MTIIRNTKDFGAGAFFIAFGAATVFLSRDYEFGVARRMGPGYFPTVLGALLVIFGLVMVARGLLGERESIGRIAFGPMAAVLGGVIAFALLLIPAGLLVATMALVLIAAIPEHHRRFGPALLLALALAAGCALVFSTLLGQAVPILGSWLSR